MTELAHTYIGNWISNSGLGERVEQARTEGICLEVYLDQIDSLKGRIHAKSTSGKVVGIIKNEWSLTGEMSSKQSGVSCSLFIWKRKDGAEFHGRG